MENIEALMKLETLNEVKRSISFLYIFKLVSNLLQKKKIEIELALYMCN
jgi:hypothetical protein